MSKLEEILMLHIKALCLPIPEREHRFSKERRFRFDFAYPGHKIGIEVDGATWANGRHNTGAGYESDCQKFDLALREGWTVYRCTGAMVKSGQAVQTIKILLAIKSAPN